MDPTTARSSFFHGISDARNGAVQRISGAIQSVTSPTYRFRRTPASGAIHEATAVAAPSNVTQLSFKGSASAAEDSTERFVGSEPTTNTKLSANPSASSSTPTPTRGQQEGAEQAQPQRYRETHRNVIIHIPSAHNAEEGSQFAAQTREPQRSERSAQDTRQSYVVVSAVAGPLGERIISQSREFTRRYIIAPMTSDPFVSSVGALLTSLVAYVDDLRVNGRVVAEDPMPHIRRLARNVLEGLLAALRTRAFGAAVAVLALVIALAKMGVFYSKQSAVSSSMEPIIFSPLTPNERTISSLPIASPLTPLPISIVSPMASLATVDKENKRQDANTSYDDGNTTPRSQHPLSDGTLKTVASRFLALFTNSPAPDRYKDASQTRVSGDNEGTTHPTVEPPVMVVNRGSYIETYEVRMTSAASPVLEDTDRFVTNLIETHVREEREKSPPHSPKT